MDDTCIGNFVGGNGEKRMKQFIKNNRTGEIKIEEVTPPILKKGGVLVQNEFSAISIGTETSSIGITKKNLIEKAKSRPEEFKKVLNLMKKEGVISTYKKVMNKLELPSPLGYSSAGRVIKVADDVDEFKVRDRVACAGSGHAEIVYVQKNLCVKIPDDMKTEYAAFTTIGSIALQGVRQSDVKLGENGLVIGLGIVGQLVVQILKSAGCRVVGIDIDENKVKISKELGADLALVRNTDGIKEKILSFTDGYGIDAAIITAATASNDPIEFASDILRDKGRITVVGAVRTDLPRKPFYEKELTLNFSRSYGPGRYDKQYEEKGVDYPIGFVRWTEKRNMEAFLNLIAEGKVNINELITHRFKFDDAVKAYEKITNSDEMILGAIFEYAEKVDKTSKISLTKTEVEKSRNLGVINVGFIGAGSYAQSYLLPILNKDSNVNFKGVATATGMNANHIGKKYGFEYVTTDANKIINNPDIDCIFIATRHNIHAKYVIAGLKANKHVYVEKPLAMKKEDLEEIKKAWEKSKGSLMVGFNRRFSPFIKKAKEFFNIRIEPLAINYRVNAGPLPPDHWIHDPEVGGGRVIGEVCHFIDLCNFLIESKPKEVNSYSVESKKGSIPNEDTIIISMKYEDGSVATISYFSNGDPRLPKERLEIFGENSCVVIDDFKKSIFISKGRMKKFNLIKQDKGQKNEIKEYIESLKNGKSLITVKELFDVAEITFKVRHSV